MPRFMLDRMDDAADDDEPYSLHGPCTNKQMNEYIYIYTDICIYIYDHIYIHFGPKVPV